PLSKFVSFVINRLFFKKNMKIGVLDIQGSVEEHFEALERLSIKPVLIKTSADFEGIKGLIIPGGESTAISKLLNWFDLKKDILEFSKGGRPIWGTCAGAILLAKEVLDGKGVKGLKLMDITVERNAYGRQLDSFETELEFNFEAKKKKIPAIFIRAPQFVRIGAACKVLAQHKGEIVAVKEGGLLATSFHPELTNDLGVHEYFVRMCS
ncbi:MAG: pyridoxal 5'-phosphate synthase glutaminase subunit PdxT, partial [Candidatus Curtissbacteria bacterium]|nr:pyridoxal 5'-phosphate synthase glutaminase subunit PdxT [Candidatus Curtissbacteria bacterium]